MKKKKKKRMTGLKKFLIFLAVLAVLSIAGTGAVFLFRVKEISYTGSTHYKDEELTKAIFGEHRANNLIYLIFGKNNETEIPFIQKYDIEITWPDRMNITVYEKAVVGYVSYMGCNMYFDKDGIVVESSTEKLSDIPQITGLDFKSIVLNSKLEVDEPGVFKKILELQQAFDKNDLTVDKIYFDHENKVTVYMGDVRVLLGECNDIVDKIFELKQMYSSLKGLKGALHMENYTQDTNSVIFKQEK